MRAALELIAGGRVDPAPLVTHRLALEQTAQALALQRNGAAVKALVLPAAMMRPGGRTFRPPGPPGHGPPVFYVSQVGV